MSPAAVILPAADARLAAHPRRDGQHLARIADRHEQSGELGLSDFLDLAAGDASESHILATADAARLFAAGDPAHVCSANDERAEVCYAFELDGQRSELDGWSKENRWVSLYFIIGNQS